MKTAAMLLAAVLVVPVGVLRAQDTATVPPSLVTGQAQNTDEAQEEAIPQDLAGDTDRVIRLSQIKGLIKLRRRGEQNFEVVLPNTPIVLADRLNSDEGFAEMQLEDGSTLRLPPTTEVEITKLLPTDSGDIELSVAKGTLYVTLAAQHQGAFTLTFGGQKLHVQPGTHMNVYVGRPETRLVVFDGTVHVETPTGMIDVSDNHTLIFGTVKGAPADLGYIKLTPPQLKAGAEKGPYDKWDRDEAKFAQQYAKNGSVNGLSSMYGAADLYYYGAFENIGGCGTMWRPYLTTAAWDPFDSGVWFWDPVALGYSWVSVYPWGWLPYHTGIWDYCGVRGWGWRPGGRFIAVQNQPRRFLRPIPPGQMHRPVGPHPPMPRPPHRPPTRIFTIAGGKLPIASRLEGSSFVLRRDSAGLGIARGTVKLNEKLSNTVARDGHREIELHSFKQANNLMGVPRVQEVHGGAPVPTVRINNNRIYSRGYEDNARMANGNGGAGSNGGFAPNRPFPGNNAGANSFRDRNNNGNNNAYRGGNNGNAGATNGGNRNGWGGGNNNNNGGGNRAPSNSGGGGGNSGGGRAPSGGGGGFGGGGGGGGGAGGGGGSHSSGSSGSSGGSHH